MGSVDSSFISPFDLDGSLVPLGTSINIALSFHYVPERDENPYVLNSIANVTYYRNETFVKVASTWPYTYGTVGSPRTLASFSYLHDMGGRFTQSAAVALSDDSQHVPVTEQNERF